MEYQPYLAHYGVLGMRWGVRRDPSKAFARAARSINRLEIKGAKKTMKGSKLQYKDAKRGDGSYSLKGSKLMSKGAKLSLKSKRLERKMAKYFSGVKLSDISPKHQEIGRKYVYMLLNN